MKLIYKLMLGFSVIALLFSAAGMFALNISQEALRAAYIENCTYLTDNALNEIDRNIYHRIEEFRAYSRDLILQEAIMASNRDFEKADNIQDYISNKDREWTAAPKDEITPYMNGLIKNKLSDELREKIRYHEERGGYSPFAEVFVTNKYGGNVAQTGKTSDYRQDDEEWWQKAKKDGLYVKDVGHDESMGGYSIDIGIRIDDEDGNFLGVIKVVLNIEDVINIIKNIKPHGRHKNHRRMHYKLSTGDGRLIYSTDKFEVFEDISAEIHPYKEAEERHMLQGHMTGGSHGKKEKIIAHAHSHGYRDYKGLGWILVLEHDAEEIFAPVFIIKKRLMMTSMAVPAIGILMGFIFSASITKNLRKITDATIRISKGDLDTFINVDSGDEIGRLAGSFNRMTRDLKKANSELIAVNEGLKESEEKFRVIFDNATDGILVADVENKKFHIANKMICKMLGYSEEEIRGLGVMDIHPEESLPHIHKQFEGQLRREVLLAENIPVKRKDGTVFYADISSTPLVLGGKTYLAGIFRDMTERKLAEEKDRKQSGFLKNILDSLTHPFYVIDVNDYTVKLANPTAMSEGLNENTTCYSLTHKQDRPCSGKEHSCPIKEIQETKKHVIVEHVHSYQDGNTKYEEVHGYPILNEDGNVVQVIEYTLDVTERKRAEEQVQRHVSRLAALHSIDKAIASSFDIKITSDILLDQVTAQLGVDAATILRLNPRTNMLEYIAGKGFRTRALKYTRLRLGESNAGRAAIERRIVMIHNLKEDIDGFASSDAFTEEGFVSYIGVPLIAKGQVKGVLELFHRSPLNTEPDWIEFAETLAGQAAIVIDNATLFEDLQRSNMEIVLAYDSTIEGWSQAMDMRDKETEGHSQRVAEMTLRMARELGVREEEYVHIRRGALLHDMGKIGVPDSILLKPGKLTDEEWQIMKLHPRYAYDMLKNIEYLRPALDIPYCHHEKWDGTGYPRGLKGDEIPLAARIFALVDVWDALTSDRPYRPAWPRERVIEHIRSLAGTHFDPRIVEIFLELESAEAHLHAATA